MNPHTGALVAAFFVATVASFGAGYSLCRWLFLSRIAELQRMYMGSTLAEGQIRWVLEEVSRA